MRTFTVSQPDHQTDTCETLLTCRRTDTTAGYRAQVALYAAYGSNLDPDQMRERCPHSPVAGTGWITGWRLTFGGEDLGWDGALATIVEDPLEQVFVAVYDVTDYDSALLDGWEAADTGLYRKTRLRVATLTGEVLAWAYVLDAYEGGLPSASYLGVLADAAEAADAPADYVAALRRRPCRSTGL
jgi:AIG2-like family